MNQERVYIFNDLHILETVFGKVMENKCSPYLMMHLLYKFYLFTFFLIALKICNFFTCIKWYFNVNIKLCNFFLCALSYSKWLPFKVVT